MLDQTLVWKEQAQFSGGNMGTVQSIKVPLKRPWMKTFVCLFVCFQLVWKDLVLFLWILYLMSNTIISYVSVQLTLSEVYRFNLYRLSNTVRVGISHRLLILMSFQTRTKQVLLCSAENIFRRVFQVFLFLCKWIESLKLLKNVKCYFTSLSL